MRAKGQSAVLRSVSPTWTSNPHCARGAGDAGGNMKFVESGPCVDPEAAARKLVEIASTIERCRTAASTSSSSMRRF